MRSRAHWKKAEDKNIKGKDLTPYLLSEIKIITSGKSLESNINLVLNNAGLAAEISVCLCRIFENNRK